MSFRIHAVENENDSLSALAAFHQCNGEINKKLEPIIIKDPFYSYYYALEVIKGRWIEAEETISKNPQSSFFYAIDVIKGKLPDDMHNAMLLHSTVSDELNEEFIKKYFKFINSKKWIKFVNLEPARRIGCFR